MPSASSSTSAQNVDANPTPLVFNQGAQYMVNTPVVVEAHIVAKEIDFLREYENHQGMPLVANPFWVVRIFLTRDIQEKAQMMHGMRE